jgi:hypothetical protein
VANGVMEGLQNLDRAGKLTPEILAALRRSGPGAGSAAQLANAPLITMTDGDGRFSFADAPPGMATIRAQLHGYFGPSINEEYPAAATAVVTIVRDAPAVITLAMTPGGTISGRILDPQGKALVDAPVFISKLAFQEGKPVLQTVNQRMTDDRGEYRAYRLAPGEYYVSAAPPAVLPARLGRSREIPVATIYPNALDFAEATAVVVQGGDEVAGTDIQMRTARPVRISGRVVSPLPLGPVTSQIGGQVRDPALFVTLTTHDRQSMQNGPLSGAVSVKTADNTFTIQDVLPGRYDIYARVPISYGWDTANPPEKSTGPWAIGRTTIDVGSDNIEDLAIAIRPGMDVRGRLLVDGRPAAYSARIALQPDDSNFRISDGAFSGIYNQVAQFSAPLGLDGLFLVPLVPEGRYRVQVFLDRVEVPAAANRGQVAATSPPATGTAVPLSQTSPTPPLSSLPQTAFIADIRQGTLSVYDNGLSVGRDPVSLDIFIGTNASGIEGTVLGPEQKPVNGMTVVLVPPASRRQNSLLYKTARSDAQGRFVFLNLEPGEYKVFAWETIPSEAYLNAAFLAQYEERGVSATTVAAGRTSVEVNVIVRQRRP